MDQLVELLGHFASLCPITSSLVAHVGKRYNLVVGEITGLPVESSALELGRELARRHADRFIPAAVRMN
jgi:hypothetical protein